jgi:hypothetical protein
MEEEDVLNLLVSNEVEVDYLDLAEGILLQCLEDCHADDIGVVEDALSWLEDQNPEFIFGYWFITRALGIPYESAEYVRVLAVEKAKETLESLKDRSPIGFLF